MDKAFPMVFAKEDQRELRNALGLDQGHDFKELIQRSKASGHEHEGDTVFNKANFAGKEIVEVNRDIGETISLLLMRQLDIEADGLSFGQCRAFVGRLHDPRSAAGDDSQVVFGQAFGQLDRGLVIGVSGQHSRGAENRNARADLGEDFKRIDEFRHNPEDAPVILLDEGDFGSVVHSGHLTCIIRSDKPVRVIAFWVHWLNGNDINQAVGQGFLRVKLNALSEPFQYLLLWLTGIVGENVRQQAEQRIQLRSVHGFGSGIKAFEREARAGNGGAATPKSMSSDNGGRPNGLAVTESKDRASDTIHG